MQADPLDHWHLRLPTAQGDSLLAAVSGASNTSYVVVGGDGRIVYSPDGASWLNEPSGTLQPLYAVSGSAGPFVVVGGQGTILSSTNGVAWQYLAYRDDQ